MSRIGAKKIVIPEKVTAKIEKNLLRASGPKGELQLQFEPNFVEFKIAENEISVTRKNDSKTARARHGLYRSLAQNLILGVEHGFSKTLELHGVGFRVAQKGQNLEMNLGFSHPVIFELPSEISVNFPDKKNQNIFTISGIDKQKVGQVAAKIRALKKPEPYKGKGFRYSDEQIVRKAGKTAKK